jgi:hypothetical protein
MKNRSKKENPEETTLEKRNLPQTEKSIKQEKSERSQRTVDKKASIKTKKIDKKYE